MTGGFKTPPPRDRQLAIPESLFPIARLHFKVIKCYHHLTTLRSSVPKSLVGTAAGLVSNLHPAFISDSFKDTAKAAADAWLHAAVEALLNHYNTEIQDAQFEIGKSPIASDAFDKCLSTAVTWSKRQLGKKLKDPDLDEACKLIRASTILTASVPPCPEPPPTPVPQPTSAPVCPAVRSVSVQTDDQPPARTDSEHVAAPPMPQRSARKRTRPSPAETSPLISQDLFASSLHPSPKPSRRRLRTTGRDDNPASDAQPPILLPSPTNDPTQPTTPVPPPASAAISSLVMPSAAVQLDLFGTPITMRKKDAAPNSTPGLFEDCKENVIIGDFNLAQFVNPSCSVYSRENGRLSHFKALLSATTDSYQHVLRFIVCLSTLDSSNTFVSNSTALKSVLGAARRVFPRAQCFVMLLGYDPTFPPEANDGIKALNNFVISKHPSSCLHVTAPRDFSVTNHQWSLPTKRSIYSKLDGCLNYA